MGQCEATTQAGNPCKRKAVADGLCAVHGRDPKEKKPENQEATKRQAQDSDWSARVKGITPAGAEIFGEHSIQNFTSNKRQELLQALKKSGGFGILLALIRTNRTEATFEELGEDAEEFDMRAMPEVDSAEALELIGGIGK